MEPDRDQWEKWKNDPSKWVWGIFYYNPEDPRFLVPKRIEVTGFTINFAHKKAGNIFLACFAGWLTLTLLLIIFK